MLTTPWLDWLVDTGQRLQTIDGKIVEVWEFHHRNCQSILSAWATHLRNHYCLDAEIDVLRQGTNFSRSDFLTKIKFPDVSNAPGPSIRAGDFGEILVADYLEHVLEYWVPRTRYRNKDIRNESTKGCDIIGFKILDDKRRSNQDILAIFEAKTQFSGNASASRLQDAIQGSNKDPLRKAESLNAIKQQLRDRQLDEDAKKVERFQNPVDRPYNEVYGAVALFSTSFYDVNCISQTDTSSHSQNNNLMLLVIRGDDMMRLVHDLYRRAADEA
ncbi:MAG: DUF1837 domain-containing protein [Chloroflexi bacterium]|nr:DUF1837 domain-containing protein [Chloroflexota bacterium]